MTGIYATPSFNEADKLIDLGADEVVRAYVWEVSPVLAQYLLEKRNTSNYRKPSTSKILRYANDMKRSGGWHAGRAIEFDSNGTAVDLQHRLAAVVKSNTSQVFTVVTGMNPRAKYTADMQGASRTAGQIIGSIIDGTYPSLPTTLRYFLCGEQIMEDNEPRKFLPKITLRGEEYANLFDSRSSLRDDIDTAYTFAKRVTNSAGVNPLKGTSPAMLAGHVLVLGMYGHSTETIEAWIGELASAGGTSVAAKTAQRVKDLGASGDGLTDSRKYAALIHGFNKFYKGEDVQQFKTPEYLPEPVKPRK